MIIIKISKVLNTFENFMENGANTPFSIKIKSTIVERRRKARVKSGKFGHQLNSDTYLQTVEIQMRRLLMSRLIRIFTVCLVNFFISIIEL